MSKDKDVSPWEGRCLGRDWTFPDKGPGESQPRGTGFVEAEALESPCRHFSLLSQ